MPKDRYVVGYDNRLAYGAWHFKGVGLSGYLTGLNSDYCHPMTLHTARLAQKKMPCKGGRLFKLVPVDVTDEK